MQIVVKDKDIFPAEVLGLLQALYSVGFFEEAIIARHINSDRLKAVIDSLKLSKKTQKAMLDSCVTIDFPPQRLGLQ